jgi:hypothetical protein
MKKGVLDAGGQVRCPKCGSTSFRTKRSATAKIGLGLAVGVGALAAPKRIKCLACGELFKARAEPVAMQAAPVPPPAVPLVGAGSTPPRPPVVGPGQTPVGMATLVLTRRTLALGPVLDVLAPLRPDLMRDQLRALVKTSKNGQVRFVTRPEGEVRNAVAQLKKLGVSAAVAP